MLDAFASVGATQFDLTITTRGETKESFRRRVKLADLSRALPAMLDSATSQQRNVIVRPHGARRFVHSARRPQSRHAGAISPRRVSHPAKPRRRIFRHGLRSPEPRTRILPAAFAKAPEPTPPPAAQRASPAASISRTNTRRTFRASQSNRRSQVERRQPPNLNGSALSQRRSRPPASRFAPARFRARAQQPRNGRTMRVASKARRSTATRPAPRSAARILRGA